tara:strand:+ start:50 stop:475 length:426 start_codon:yes stop_codon:yes gene_type:complete
MKITNNVIRIYLFIFFNSLILSCASNIETNINMDSISLIPKEKALPYLQDFKKYEDIHSCEFKEDGIKADSLIQNYLTPYERVTIKTTKIQISEIWIYLYFVSLGRCRYILTDDYESDLIKTNKFVSALVSMGAKYQDGIQ